jgi:hypothetical protein
MSRRRTSSPYPKPPTPFVRAAMNDGWRRCDAESLAVVEFCVRNAMDPRPSLPVLARYAGEALLKEPVLAAAALRLTGSRSVAEGVWRLTAAAPLGLKYGFYRLWLVANAAASQNELLDELRAATAREDEDEGEDEFSDIDADGWLDDPDDDVLDDLDAAG